MSRTTPAPSSSSIRRRRCGQQRAQRVAHAEESARSTSRRPRPSAACSNVSGTHVLGDVGADDLGPAPGEPAHRGGLLQPRSRSSRSTEAPEQLRGRASSGSEPLQARTTRSPARRRGGGSTVAREPAGARRGGAGPGQRLLRGVGAAHGGDGVVVDRGHDVVESPLSSSSSGTCDTVPASDVDRSPASSSGTSASTAAVTSTCSASLHERRRGAYGASTSSSANTSSRMSTGSPPGEPSGAGARTTRAAGRARRTTIPRGTHSLSRVPGRA